MTMSKGIGRPEGLEVLVGDDEVVISFALGDRREDMLSAAESEIVVDLLAGRSNAEIARSRKRSLRTVANQVSSVLRKLRVRSRFELAARIIPVVPQE